MVKYNNKQCDFDDGRVHVIDKGMENDYPKQCLKYILNRVCRKYNIHIVSVFTRNGGGGRARIRVQLHHEV